MIRTIDLNKSFGHGDSKSKVLKDINLHIYSGEIVSIMGPSGCGKTTLLQILSGLDGMDSGQVWIDGIALHEKKDRELTSFRLRNMGFIFQSYHLIPVLNALENVAVPLIAQGVSEREAKKVAMEVLKNVGLNNKAFNRPSELSGGQNQRVAIARAIVCKPKVIWADEPTGALDSQTSEQIVGLLSLLNETYGTTIVIVTHDTKVSAKAGRVIKMENGRILSHGGGIHV